MPEAAGMDMDGRQVMQQLRYIAMPTTTLHKVRVRTGRMGQAGGGGSTLNPEP